MKNKFIISTIFSSLLISLSAYAAPVQTSAVQTVQHQKITQQYDLLYTQLAKAATIQLDPNSNQSGTLTLHHVNQHTTWFSDRPERVAGVMTTSHFIQNWQDHGTGKNSFQVVPPNANLVALANKHKMNPITHGAFELSMPQYNTQRHTLSYHIKAIGNTKLQNHKHIRDVALFIDSQLVGKACFPWGGC